MEKEQTKPHSPHLRSGAKLLNHNVHTDHIGGLADSDWSGLGLESPDVAGPCATLCARV